MKKRFTCIPPLLALLAFGWLAVHCWPHAAPDRASIAIAGYAGLQPFRPLTTPLWGALVQAVAAIPAIPLAAALCWIHVLIGAAIVYALADLLMRLPYRRLSKQRQLSESQAGGLNAVAAVAGGGFILASLPFTWAFRSPQPESLAWLALAWAANLLVRFLCGGRLRLLYAAFAFVGLGAVESASVALAMPALAAPALLGLWRRRLLSWRVFIALIASGALGGALVFIWVWLYHASPVAAWREIPSYFESLRLFVREYKAAGPTALPRQGWLLILALSLLPLLFVYGRSAEEREDSLNEIGIFALRFAVLPLVAWTVLYEGPGSPMRASNHATLLLTPYLAAALWFGRLSGIAVGWAAFPRPRHFRAAPPRRAAPIFAALAVVAFVAAPLWLHRSQRSDDLLQASRRLMQDAMIAAGETGRLLSDGPLDSALAITARDRRARLPVVNLAALPQRAYQRYVHVAAEFPDPAWIEQFGLETSLRDWLARAAHGGGVVASLLSRELHLPPPLAWQPAGAAMVARTRGASEPQGLQDALQALRAVAVPRGASRDPGLAAAASWLSAYTARMANEIGVRLHAAGDLPSAREAFRLALAAEPDHLAALINDQETARALGAPVDDAAAAAIRRRLADLPPVAALSTLRARYGRIVHPDAARAESAEWASYGFDARAREILQSESPDAAPPADEEADRRTALLQQGDWSAALAELDAALAERPEDLSAHIAKIRLLIGNNLYSEADAAIADWRARGWPRAAADWEEARLLLAQGRADEAEARIRAAVAERPNDPSLRLLRAMLAERSGRSDAWRDALAALEKHTAGYLPGLHYLAAHAIRNRDYDAARRYLTAARAVRPGDRAVLEGLLTVETLTPGSPNREAAARALLQADPDNAAAWHALGAAAAGRGRWDLAADALERAARSAPTARTLNDWAWALHQLGRADEALAQAARACEAEPQNGFVWSTRGKIALDAGRYAEAAQGFERAIENRHRPASVELALLQAYHALTNRTAAAKLRAELESRAHMLSAAEIEMLESIPNR